MSILTHASSSHSLPKPSNAVYLIAACPGQLLRVHRDCLRHGAPAPGFFARHKISRWHAVQEQPCFSGRTGSKLYHTADWPGRAVPSKAPLLQQVMCLYKYISEFLLPCVSCKTQLVMAALWPGELGMIVLAELYDQAPLFCRRLL